MPLTLLTLACPNNAKQRPQLQQNITIQPSLLKQLRLFLTTTHLFLMVQVVYFMLQSINAKLPQMLKFQPLQRKELISSMKSQQFSMRMLKYLLMKMLKQLIITNTNWTQRLNSTQLQQKQPYSSRTSGKNNRH
ncbi:Hypothetical_protein [Hexamita inflata]|uniref:Hypothetical_protein n=1 Tax=Hexamita inflata TaxID=28002 RepID=A0AA86V4I0_9EUKA|nr:Hypothetical protein HINF_LOCUS63692 [Hexamita inflata]